MEEYLELFRNMKEFSPETPDSRDDILSSKPKPECLTVQKGVNDMLDGDNLTLEEYRELFANMQEVHSTYTPDESAPNS